jgi:dTDP-D-glucose 4,6-dehydratase
VQTRRRECIVDLSDNAHLQDEYIEFVEDRRINDVRYAIDSGPMKQLGWEPAITWEEGLLSTSMKLLWPL